MAEECCSALSCCFRCCRRSAKLHTNESNDEYPFRELKAKLYTISTVHFYLPFYPVAWMDVVIPRHKHGSFMQTYIITRPRYGTLKLIGAVLVFTLGLPILYANFMMPYPCAIKEIMEMKLVNGTVVDDMKKYNRQLGCFTEDYLKDPMSLRDCAVLFGASISLIHLFQLLAYIIHMGPEKIKNTFRLIELNLLLFAKPLLPRLFYNGMGPVGTSHSSWRRFSRHGLQKEWSYLHDLYGAVDYVIGTILLAVLLILGLALSGWVSAEAEDLTRRARNATAGAVLGLALARLVFLVMNYVVGAPSDFVAIVEEELKRYRPEDELLSGDSNEINQSHLDIQLQKAMKVFTKWERELEGSKKHYREHYDKFMAAFKARGREVLVELVEDIKSDNLYKLNGVVHDLFQTQLSIFCTSFCGLSVLASLDMVSYLAAYFDPNLIFCDYVDGWRRKFILTSVYIAVPDACLCQHRRSSAHPAYWHVHETPGVQQRTVMQLEKTLSRTSSSSAQDA
eukprot:TRINITY_DN54630_c0_g1_i1.p1 TRINITY_DN54630_c0_g1~~TRINITY_DN54630_c0_g1_i1.p1  ORF type:complete len:508 (-),score=51.60 TRINITY_DN54630_c0_g1_i1:56-1579(-)